LFYKQATRNKKQAMAHTLGTLHYQADTTDAGKKTATIISDPFNRGTIVLYNGVTYKTTIEWMTKAFQNSGKSCYVRIERSSTMPSGTPRPTRYVPPNQNCPFGQFC
jgi:hypothetical protein